MLLCEFKHIQTNHISLVLCDNIHIFISELALINVYVENKERLFNVKPYFY